MTFDTLQNTSECHEVPRLPRETQKLPLLENLPEARPYSNRADGWLRVVADGWATGTLATHSGKERERKGTEGTGRERKGKEWKGRERKGKEGKGRERKGKEGKGRERMGKEGKGRERTGKEGKEGKGKERLIWKSAAIA